MTAMRGALRWIQPFLVTLLTASLMLGVYGLEGAIHSVHHLLPSDALHQQDVDDGEDDHGAAGLDPGQACHVAAAASHAADTVVGTLPGVSPAPMDAQPLHLPACAVPRLVWTDPHRGRAPPPSRLLSS